jgi:hypothetical protein
MGEREGEEKKRTEKGIGGREREKMKRREERK